MEQIQPSSNQILRFGMSTGSKINRALPDPAMFIISQQEGDPMPKWSVAGELPYSQIGIQALFGMEVKCGGVLLLDVFKWHLDDISYHKIMVYNQRKFYGTETNQREFYYTEDICIILSIIHSLKFW